MEELKKGFKGLWNKASNQMNQATGPGFKGSGQRLGTAEERGERPKVQGQGAVSSQQPGTSSSGTSASGRPGSSPVPAAPRSATPNAASASTRVAAAPMVTAPRLAPSTEFDPFAATLGTGAALNTIRTEDGAPNTHPSTSTSTSSHPAAAAAAAVSAAQVEEMQHALALIVSEPQRGGSLEVLHKLLSNLAARPQEAKVRQVRLSNPRVQEAVVRVTGGLQLLQAVGFHVEMDAADDEGFAVFLDDAALPLVHEGLRQLNRVMSSSTAGQQPARQLAARSSTEQPGASGSGNALQTSDSSLLPSSGEALQPAAGIPAPLTATASAATAHTEAASAAATGPAATVATAGPAATSTSTPIPTAAAAAAARGGGAAGPSAAAASADMPAALQPPPRNLQVLLPVAPDTDVPSWFFERTGADVKAEYMRLLKARRDSQVFTWRSPSPTQPPSNRRLATLRIRFPEGVTLQGDFGASEPLTAVHEFVTSAMRDASTTFELALPSRQPLPLAGRVVDVPELLPSALLNFRRLGGAGGEQGPRLPFLQDALLRQARLT